MTRISVSMLRGNMMVRRAREGLKSERRWRAVKTVMAIVLAVAFAGAMVAGLAGCATSASLAAQARDHATLRGLVRVAQMGEDCASDHKALKQALVDIFVNNHLPAPSIVEVVPLSGSSYCGFAQGTANEVVMLELGARNTAIVKATVYWRTDGLTSAELEKADATLKAMRPIAAAPKVARNPAK